MCKSGVIFLLFRQILNNEKLYSFSHNTSSQFCKALCFAKLTAGVMRKRISNGYPARSHSETTKSLLRQDTPPPPGPPWFEFLVIFDFFLHHGIEQVAAHLLWKFHKKNSKEKLVKYATEVARLHKVSKQSSTQNRPFSESSNRAREIEFNFLSFGLSLWNLAHLFIMFMATKHCPQIF